MKKSDICVGDTDDFSVRQKISSKCFEPILISVLALAVSGAACGGSDKKDDDPEDVDSGIVVSDAGIVEKDAGIIEDDAGSGDENVGYISIPAGSFTLSHDTGTYSSGDTVSLGAFALKKTPVTVAEFEKCVAAKKCTSEHYKTVSDDDYCNYNRGDDWKNHPMNCIDWDGAKEYCEWIGGRLPSEEEWEYAATHNGTRHLDTTYPWGDDAPTHCVSAQYYRSSTGRYCQGNAAAPMSNDERDGTSDVSLHSPAGDSPLGLVDMLGNVWEWTSSFYSDGSPHAFKGASWVINEFFLSFSHRDGAGPAYTSNDVGVRCAK